MGILDSWKEKIAHYIDVRLRLVKLAIVERISGILSYLILTFIGLFLSMGILIFLGIALAEYFAEIWASRSLAYLLTAGIFVLLFLCIFALRRLIVRAISGIFIGIMTDVDEEEKAKTNDEKSKDHGAVS